MSGQASRREAVLEAALTIIARDGLRSLTHRSIAAEMGTSVRAATYHFASIEELIEAAFSWYVERALERFHLLAESLPASPSAEEAGEALWRALEIDLVSERRGLVLEYTVLLELERRPTLAPGFQVWQGALLALIERCARAMASPRPALHARLVLATLRGLELEALSRPGEAPRTDEVRAVFNELLAGLSALAPRAP